ncbi:MAG: TetR/AcrR family transcriptional regulator [Thermoleophilia bacterium]|nr:TetR/AcrR family transcriptional regulator [Thermoleophilia bacterium]
MSRRRLKPDERRAEIIGAAIRSFTSQPYTEVSMAEIADEADASRALLTHYYGDKEALYAAVIHYLIDQLESMVRTDLDLSGRELIDANLTSLLDLLISQREAAVSFFNGGPAGRDVDVSGAIEDLNSHLVSRILQNHFGSDDAPPATRLAVLGFVGFGSSVIFDWLQNETISRDELHELLATNLENALATKDGG